MVDDAKEVVLANTQDVTVDVLDEVATRLIPLDEMMLTEVGVNNVGDDVSPLDAMRLAGSIS